MINITVSGASCASGSGANPPHKPADQATQRAADDELLRLLIISRTLATGRTLPAGVPPQKLTEEELISFWADD
jgi:hypothetical protein